MAHPTRRRVSSERLHRGDVMSAEARSALMARIRGRGTKPELVVEQLLVALGVRYEMHARDLPGRPDFVIRDARVVVLVDGDFWHGWRFREWRMKLSEKWEAKIAANIRRDARNRCELRRASWIIVRLWEHQIERSPLRCKARIRAAVVRGLRSQAVPGSVAGDLVGDSDDHSSDRSVLRRGRE